MSKPVTVTDSTYQQEVIDSETPVLVDFWAPWCGPCRIVGPVLEEIAAEQPDKIKIVKVNVDENQQYAGQLGVFNIPTMILYKGGQPVDKIIGAMPKQMIMDRLEPHLG
ncbi:MAG TPA: thioredoxin [Thermomicrobiales bacterium]|nr:thioredoxin [Thermomicrobiales bacterium]